MKFILGKKLGMSQVYNNEGKRIPVTLIEAGPCFVSQIRTKENDGYEAVQVGFEKTKKVNKPVSGHLKKANIPDLIRNIREFRVDAEELAKYSLGQKLDVSMFNENEKVKVSGTSKAKGFQGVVKRHGFRGAPASHGTKHALRSPGAIGGGGRAGGRVAKGMRMGGRMGGERVTISGLKVIKVVPQDNLLAVEGAVAGRRGTILEIKA